MSPSMFEPMYLSTSNVPHTHTDAVGRLHRKQLGPLCIRAIGDLNHTLVSPLLPIDPRSFSLLHVDVSNSTIGGQVSVVDRGDCKALAKTR